jgi:hypothetical protein
MQIQYIGAKSKKTDNVAGTGLTWAAGQAHDVPNLDACAKLLRHSDVWALADGAAVPETPETGTDDGGKTDEVMPELDALRKRLTDLGIKFHHKAGAEKLQALLDQNEAAK